MSAWKNYWFNPSPYLDLAILRIVAVGVQVWLLTIGAYLNFGYFHELMSRARLPEELWNPLLLVNIIGFVGSLEWGYRPTPEILAIIFFVAVAVGCLALIGVLTNVSLCLFAVANVYLHGNIYSYSDFHHSEAVMMIALSVLAISPSGRVLSVDSWFHRKHHGEPSQGWLERNGDFCGWPIKLLQWFFVLMYLSAIWMKTTLNGGLDWANGFTLQYYMAQDGLRWDRPLALWLSQWHWPILLGQWVVLIFQTTFTLAVIFPRLRFIYLPLGLFFHGANWLILGAAFPQWIALYVIFIPWRKVLNSMQRRGYEVGLNGARN